MRYFEQYFNWEVDSAESTPPEAILKSASYRHPCKADGTGFYETKCSFRTFRAGYYLDAEMKCSAIPKLDLPHDII